MRKLILAGLAALLLSVHADAQTITPPTPGNTFGPSSSTSGDIATFSGTTGKVLQDSGIAVTTVVIGPAVAVSGNLPTFSGTTGKLLQDSGIPSGAIPAANLSLSQITASVITADVAMNNTNNYFDGPSIAQGVSGTWFASGTVTVTDTAGGATFYCKLWDGTTVIASATSTNTASNNINAIALSGYLASPAANIKISCRDATSTSGLIKYDASGNAKDSTISAFRVK